MGRGGTEGGWRLPRMETTLLMCQETTGRRRIWAPAIRSSCSRASEVALEKTGLWCVWSFCFIKLCDLFTSVYRLHWQAQMKALRVHWWFTSRQCPRCACNYLFYVKSGAF